MQIIMSGMLQVMGGKGQGYRNCSRVANQALVQLLCVEEMVEFVDFWEFVVVKEIYFDHVVSSRRVTEDSS